MVMALPGLINELVRSERRLFSEEYLPFGALFLAHQRAASVRDYRWSLHVETIVHLVSHEPREHLDKVSLRPGGLTQNASFR